MRVLGLFALLMGLSVSDVAAAECLSYDRAVEITGYFDTIAYPGVPQFKDINKGDKREVVPLMLLRLPGVCINADTDEPQNLPHQEVTVVQLDCTGGDLYATLFRTEGSPITIRGYLSGAAKPDHVAPVLLHDCELVTD